MLFLLLYQHRSRSALHLLCMFEVFALHLDSVSLEYDLHFSALTQLFSVTDYVLVFHHIFNVCAVLQEWLWLYVWVLSSLCCVSSLQVVAVTLRQTLSSRWLTTRRISLTGGRYPSPPSPAHPLTSSFQLKINPLATFLHHWGRNGLNATRTVATVGPARPLRMSTCSPGTAGTHTMANTWSCLLCQLICL